MTQPNIPNRISYSLEQIISAILSRVSDSLVRYTVWTYTVAGVTPGRPVKIDCRSTNPIVPDLQQIPLWPGPCGCYATPLPGSTVRVGFVNGTLSQPYVVGLDPASNAQIVTSPADVSMLLAGGSDFVALATSVKAELTKLQTTLSSAVAPSGGGPVTYSVPYSPGNVAATKVMAT